MSWTSHKKPNFKFQLMKKGVTSGGSRKSYKFFRKLPLSIRIRKLNVIIFNKAGRNSSGRVVFWTRKSLSKKKRALSINHNFRLRFLGFVGTVQVLPFTHKVVSLLFLSNGSMTYIPTAQEHRLFYLTRMYPVRTDVSRMINEIYLTRQILFIKPAFLLISSLLRSQPVSLLELTPGQGVKYIRSPGCSGRITKIDKTNNTILIRLPSGVRKVFSSFSLGANGVVPISTNKYWKSNKAGYYSNHGRKPKVRGVAMNPIDHPHGGRTKAISYQRTPWGKTTKYK